MRLEGQKWRQERVLRRFWRPRAPFWRPKGSKLIYDVDFWEGSVEWRDVFGYAKSTASTAEHLTISHALASLADAADFLRSAHATDPSIANFFSKIFSKFLLTTSNQIFKNDRLWRCDSFRQKIVKIGAILAIFEPFEV